MDIGWEPVLQHSNQRNGWGSIQTTWTLLGIQTYTMDMVWDLVLQHGHSLGTSQTTKILFGNHSYNMDTFGDPI